MRRALRILGIRGIPDRHGGFESFAQDLAPYLVRKGWSVTVYCQEQNGDRREDWWAGVRLVRMPVRTKGARGTIAFDWASTLHALQSNDLVLVLGYNTAVFGCLDRHRGIPYVINMDGLEWKRQKYGPLERAWLFANEWIACKTADHIIADHPLIHERYAPRHTDVTTVPYGSRAVHTADLALLAPWQLRADAYALVIARPAPENSIVEIVRAYSARQRGLPLVVLGHYDTTVCYQRAALDAAGSEVIFPGAVYERAIVDAFRYFAALYIHGHQVGGTNPSLVEALGAGSPVLAHDNRFNRWVCGYAGRCFASESDLACELGGLLADGARDQRTRLRERARRRHESMFALERRLTEYESVLLRALSLAPLIELSAYELPKHTI